jgi:hypothetical protein
MEHETSWNCVFLSKIWQPKDIIPIQIQQQYPIFHEVIRTPQFKAKFLPILQFSSFNSVNEPHSHPGLRCQFYLGWHLWTCQEAPKGSPFLHWQTPCRTKPHAEPSWEQNIPLILVIWKGIWLMSEGTYHSDCTNERDQPSRLAETHSKGP